MVRIARKRQQDFIREDQRTGGPEKWMTRVAIKVRATPHEDGPVNQAIALKCGSIPGRGRPMTVPLITGLVKAASRTPLSSRPSTDPFGDYRRQATPN